MTINAANHTMNIGAGGVLEHAPVVGSLTITPSINSGVAPLGVHFSIFASVDVATRAEFMDSHYTWGFDDAASGTFESGESRNSAYGPLAGHVFDTPGTHTITVTQRNVLGVVATGQIDIIVTDPDVVYSGLNTVCISTSGAFTGAPTGADLVTTSNVDVIETHLRAGKRVLLRVGESWSVAGSSINPFGSTDAILGYFGTGTNPNIHGIFDNAPIITGNEAQELVTSDRNPGFRMTGVSIVNTYIDGDNASKCVKFEITNGDAPNVLLHRVKITGGSTAISLGAYTYSDITNLMVSDCVIHGNTYDFYGQLQSGFMIGNNMHETTSHNVRIIMCRWSVIANNITLGSGGDLHNFKIHGPGNALYNQGQSLSEWNVFASNIMGGGGNWTVAIGPQSDSTANRDDDNLRYFLIERNRFYPNYGTLNTPTQDSLHLNGRDHCVRNNIFRGDGAGNGWRAININKRNFETAPDSIEVYNNTFSRLEVAASSIGVEVAPSATNCTVINSFGDLTNSTSSAMLNDLGTGTTASNNIDDPTPDFIDESNADFLLKNFDIAATSGAVGAGIAVNVWTDYNGTVRPVGGSYDVGAHEYEA